MKKYPECEKMQAVKDKSQAIGEFIEWLGINSMFIGEYHEDGYPCHAMLNTEQLLAKYFNINLNKVEKEKRSMLADLQKK